MSLLTSLVSYWKLDEASGNALDAHGANALTENGTVGTGAGKVSTARDFPSSALTNYFSHVNNSDLQTGDIDFTFACWFNADALNGGQTGGFPVLAHKGWDGTGSTDREWVLYFDGGNTKLILEMQPASGPTVLAQWSANISITVWYHLVVWHDSVNNQIGLCLNAGTPVTTANTLGVATNTRAFQLGTSTIQSLYFDGRIDEVGFWKRVLTSQERTDLYGGGSGLAYPFASASAPVALRQYRQRRIGRC